MKYGSKSYTSTPLWDTTGPVTGLLYLFIDEGKGNLKETPVFYAFFWVICRRLNFIYRRFGTLCSIFIGGSVWRMTGVENIGVLSCRGHESVELYLYSPYGPYGLYRASVPVQGLHVTFTLYSDVYHSCMVGSDSEYRWCGDSVVRHSEHHHEDDRITGQSTLAKML